jgi:O-antigen ligase
MLLVRSSSRSAAAALVVALLLLVYLFRATLSRAMVLATVALALAPALLPALSGQVSGFIVKERPDIVSEDRLAVTIGSRIPVWTAHLNGFKERPILGWGFGLDSDADLSSWKGELTALSLATRDPVNDVLFALESGGLVGLLAYLIILSTTLVAWLPRGVRLALDGSTPLAGATRSVYDSQRLFLVLSVMYIVLFEGDSTAFAAGNFAAAMLWVMLGGALWARGALEGSADTSSIRAACPVTAASIPRQA